MFLTLARLFALASMVFFTVETQCALVCQFQVSSPAVEVSPSGHACCQESKRECPNSSPQVAEPNFDGSTQLLVAPPLADADSTFASVIVVMLQRSSKLTDGILTSSVTPPASAVLRV